MSDYHHEQTNVRTNRVMCACVCVCSDRRLAVFPFSSVSTSLSSLVFIIIISFCCLRDCHLDTYMSLGNLILSLCVAVLHPGKSCEISFTNCFRNVWFYLLNGCFFCSSSLFSVHLVALKIVTDTLYTN